MKKRTLAVFVCALMIALCTAGCGKTADTAAGAESRTLENVTESQTEVPKEEKTETQKDVGENLPETIPSPKNPEAKEKTSDTGILAVSFGTSYNDNREKTIGAIERAIGDAFPEYEMRRAFTAQMIIDKLKKRDGLEVDNVTQALERMAADGIENLVVQPTHLMDGLEYQDVVQELKKYENSFKKIVVGKPLLMEDEDFTAVAIAITDATKSYDDGETAIVYMGHGTEADSNQIYGKLQETLKKEGFENYFIGTVEAEPTLEDVIKSMEDKKAYKNVVLAPLMVVCGDHANNDMAGEEEDSWKSVLTAKGYQVECLLQGLGELKTIQEIYVNHVKEALRELE
ncbi:sirohydrochlorin cobaltochelatase [Clostridiaceae bacterium]|nr:sirohydrochlorin cobaltochelatase [Clostridiaceae bacterium]